MTRLSPRLSDFVKRLIDRFPRGSIITGVGSRDIPHELQRDIANLSYNLGTHGFRFRSGAAPGADTAFEAGFSLAGAPSAIYLPWKNFHNKYRFEERNLTYGPLLDVVSNPPATTKFIEEATPEAFLLARHRNILNGSKGRDALMARNMHQVLGHTLQTPAQLMLAAPSSPRSGTSHAMDLAADLNIPTFNLFDPSLSELRTNPQLRPTRIDPSRPWLLQPRQSGAVDIGRKGPFGNPNWAPPEEKLKGLTLPAYSDYLNKRLASDPDFAAQVKALANKPLWCPGCQSFTARDHICHGSILLRAIDRLNS